MAFVLVSMLIAPPVPMQALSTRSPNAATQNILLAIGISGSEVSLLMRATDLFSRGAHAARIFDSPCMRPEEGRMEGDTSVPAMLRDGFEILSSVCLATLPESGASGMSKQLQ